MIRSFVLVVLALGALGLALLYAGQRWLIYHPNRQHVLPREVGLRGVEELRLATADGETVIAWWAKAPPGRPTLLYFHGNAGSLGDRAERLRNYQSAGLGIFIMAYRGYSGSTGRPSEAANIADAQLALQKLLELGVAKSDIIVYGESLGSGVATQVAANEPFAGLILDAPYTSLVDVGAQRHPFLPVRLLMIDRYETMKFIDRIRSPLLIVHGARDTIIPVGMGRAVLAAAPEPKTMVVVPDGTHSDHYHGSFPRILAWIDALPRLKNAGAVH